MAETRKLSTILFADIVGYTSLMQSNEQKAMQFLKTFKSILEDAVPGFDGEIVQYFGDACLLSFKTASEGVQCAIAIQSLFQKNDIPIRIGMHLGEVIFTEDNVFGDGVNVASRIESMGVPGGILISKIVRQQIKNKSEFKLTSLGHFEFKNVEEPLEVFAIANEGFVVPKREDVTGKFKTPISKSSHKRTFQLIGVSLIALFLVWFISLQKALLSDEQINSQLAVVPFENKTGENELEEFGTMISDWLTSGLRETGETNIRSALNLQNQVMQAGLVPQSINKLYARSGIGVIISGRYYLQGENMYIQANITDTRTGQIIHSSDPVVRPKNQIEDILYELKQDILGFWQIQDLNRFRQRPPRYKAYQEYLSGLQKFNKGEESAEINFKNAYELDTTFFSSLLKLSVLYSNHGRYFDRDSLFNFLADNQTKFTQWELLYYKFLIARTTRQWYDAGQFAEQATQIDPSSRVSFFRSAQAYKNGNYQQKAIDVMQSIDWSLNGQGTFKGWIDEALFMQGKHQEVLASLRKYKSEGPLDPIQKDLYMQILVERGLFDEISDLVMNTPSTGRYNKGILLYNLSISLLVHKKDQLARHYALMSKDFALNHPDRPDYLILLGGAEMFLQNWNQAIKYFESYIAENGLMNKSNFGFRLPLVFGNLAACYAHIGEISKAKQLLKDISWHSSFEPYINYNLAIVQTINGEHNNAIQSLILAVQSGAAFDFYSYGYDHHLIPLFDNPTFQELIRVKG